MLKLFFDGGCRPNPGPIETAVVVGGVAHVRTDHPVGGNGDAEWLALLHAVAVARTMGAADIMLIGDSAQVVLQAGGRTPARGPSARWRAAFDAAIGSFARVRVRRVGRSRNLAGIALAARHPR